MQAEQDLGIARPPVPLFGIEQINRQLLHAVRRLTTRGDDRERNQLAEGPLDALSTIQNLLHLGADPDAADHLGNTCLHYIAEHNFERSDDIINLLLDAGASLDLADAMGNTPLLLAAGSERENLELIGKLIFLGADVNKRNSRGWSSLHLAASLGKAEIVQMLLLSEASPNIRDDEGNTPLLHILAYYQSRIVPCADIAQQLIQGGANVNTANSNGMTSLHLASLRNHEEAVKMLLEEGASTSAVDKDGRTALFYATKSQNVQLVHLLIRAGCDVNYINPEGSDSEPFSNPTTALHLAILNDDLDMIKFLLDNGANPNQTNNLGEKTLAFALRRARSGTINYIMKHLLSHGADKHDLGPGIAESPLELLVSSDSDITSLDRVPEIRLLFEHGFDLSKYNPQSPSDFSPLHKAIWTNGHSGILSLILKYNSKNSLNLEHEDEDGCSPLITAVRNKSPDSVKLLLDAGANANHPDSNGRSPLALAISEIDIHRINPLNSPWRNLFIQFLVGAGAEFRQVLRELVLKTSFTNDEIIVDFFSLHQLRCWFEAAKFIIKWRVLYESHNLSVPDPINHDDFGGSDELKNYYETCKTEIALLKNSPLTDSFSYYDVLTADENFYKRVRSDRVYDVFDRDDLDLPVFAEDLSERFSRIARMHCIWEKAVEKLGQYLKQFFCSEAHYSIIRNILKYLPDEDLESVADINDSMMVELLSDLSARTHLQFFVPSKN